MTPGKLAGLDVSRETMARLEAYAALVRKWNPRINLVSRKSLDALWERHIADSAQIYHLAGDAPNWLDLGSGGGFPGLVVAILATDLHPDRQVTLIESDTRKATFLRTAIRELGLSAQVLAQRIEAAEPQRADILSARALTDLSGLLAFAERHLSESGLALFPKGASWKNELEPARAQWSFNLEAITSFTEPEAAILKIQGVARV
ncbi:16S rRNA (guanine(527)-N(7))-methyltransferase RsmG [Pseudooceanicola sp.]|uniref:16S rRNA (guanine(527)-N(7))-methyltransferase RsmG n=1 Tax=Pseudooceanicola sp. TaxID=1914328 RepID=UPI003516898C